MRLLNVHMANRPVTNEWPSHLTIMFVT